MLQFRAIVPDRDGEGLHGVSDGRVVGTPHRVGMNSSGDLGVSTNDGAASHLRDPLVCLPHLLCHLTLLLGSGQLWPPTTSRHPSLSLPRRPRFRPTCSG